MGTIELNPKSIDTIADNKFTQWIIKRNYPIHYQIVLAQDELSEFVKKELEESRASVDKFNYYKADNLSNIQIYENRDRSTKKVNWFVNRSDIEEKIKDFKSSDLRDTWQGTTYFGAIADIYLQLGNEKSATKKLIRLHGKYHQYQYLYDEHTEEKRLKLYLHSNGEYAPDASKLALAKFRDGQILNLDGTIFQGK